ncbi:MAG: radical SAM protein [Lachnospiraceae bacterium]|nr:radical SAM protein [Lachnospiraceae bacterium]
MHTIILPNEKVTAFLSTKYPETNTGWRWSVWAVHYAQDGKYVIKHSFSGEIITLSDEEYTNALNNEELRRRRYVVPNDFDEATKYKEVVGLIKLTNPESEGLRTYTILPTTACNARCVYCYEEGYAVSTMTQATAERLVDFICETKQEEKITLAWFGGEPLVGTKTISFICNSLAERNVPFRSRMITNGSLFTTEMVKEATEIWKLEKVQVSLDGDRRDYEDRKRYIYPLKDNYDIVMKSIRLLADVGIKVNLRVNFDRENIGRLRPFLLEMKERFSEDKNVSLYLSALYQEKEKPYFIELEREMFELNRYVRELGINYENREKIQTSFRLNGCMADALDKTIVIHPDGRFYDCEHLPEGHSWGNIFDGVTDRELFERLSAPHEIDERCAKCPYLPQCTPFYIKGCPGWFEKCREYMELKTEYELRRIAETCNQR